MNRLTKLANKYETDKGTTFDYKHGYTEIYEPYFLAYEKPTILELGVDKGAAEKMLNDFYDGDCDIYCIDIEDKTYIFENYPNIHFYQMDLGDENAVNEFINSLGDIKFDIIIDDASHQPLHQYISLLNFRRCLNNGGIFIMEDLHTSYDKDFEPIFQETPLMFLAGLKSNKFFFNEEEYTDFINSLGDVAIYSFRNNIEKMNGWFNRSVTAIIKFENKQ